MLKLTASFFVCVSIFLLCQHSLFGMDRRLAQSLQQRMRNVIHLTTQRVDIERQLKNLTLERSHDDCCRLGMALAGECCACLPEFEGSFDRTLDWFVRLGFCSFVSREASLYYQESLKKARKITELRMCKEQLECALAKYKK